MFFRNILRFEWAKYAQTTLRHYQVALKENITKCIPFGLVLGLTSGATLVNCSAAPAPAPAHLHSNAGMENYRPRNGYFRIDGRLEKMHPEILRSNAFHGTLSGENMIEDYEVYYNPESKDIICLVRYGSSLNGHNGIVHGGITALTFDNSFGWLFIANDTAPAFTANLTLNYRKPVPQNSLVMLRCKLTKVEGRKLFMSGTMEDVNGSILMESSCLYVEVKQPESYDGGLPNGQSFDGLPHNSVHVRANLFIRSADQ